MWSLLAKIASHMGVFDLGGSSILEALLILKGIKNPGRKDSVSQRSSQSFGALALPLLFSLAFLTKYALYPGLAKIIALVFSSTIHSSSFGAVCFESVKFLVHGFKPSYYLVHFTIFYAVGFPDFAQFPLDFYVLLYQIFFNSLAPISQL